MAKKSLFDTLYSQLNTEQKKAVDTVEGPVMVVAGPGTGKTYILTLRIAKILKETDIEPENILALTFTEAASHEMRERLVAMMGAEAYRVGIFTFHGFCNDIIQRNSDEFPDIIGAVHITDIEQVERVKEILEDSVFSLLRPFGNPSYYVRPLLRRVSDLKRAGISTEEFAKHIAEQQKEFKKLTKGTKRTGKEESLEKQIARNKELALFYEKYQKMLHSSLLYDYDDMILKVVEVLSGRGDLLISLQEQYLYLLADEHQDVNYAQNTVLELLSSFHKSPNLFIVGDEKQAIFRFQGASLENFRYFQQKHPDAEFIRLKQNYRSTQNILDGAGHVMQQTPGSLHSNISGAGEKIEIFAFSTLDVEMFALAQQIKGLVKSGVKTSEIAVLFRDNKDAQPVVQMLEKQGIPFALEAEHDILSDENMKKLVALFKAVDDFGSDELLFQVLGLDFWGLDPLSVLQQVRRARDKGITLTEAIRSSQGRDASLLREISKKMAAWHTMAKNRSGLEVFEYIVRDSGFLSYLLSHSNSHVQIEKLRGLYEEMRLVNGSSLSDFLSHLNSMEENRVSLRKNIHTPMMQGVRVMTVHRAKGREFTYVFLVNVYDGHWGRRRVRQTFLLPERISLVVDPISSEDEEERKLFYVALTRARTKVVISYAKTRLDGRSLLPSRFISEIAEKFTQKGNEDIYEKAFAKKGDILFSAPQTKKPDYREKKFVRELFSQRGLSVSALNNYLRCPLQYFYINLVQIPQSPSKSQLYGTVVHNTLRDFFDKLSKDDKVSKAYLLSRLKAHALRIFDKKDAKEVIIKGTKALSGYYDAYRKSFHAKTLNELSIRDVVLNGVRLTGKLDKIELGKGREVNVVDYKTGRLRSRNEIEGKTKAGTGDYKRQLVFYKLLLDSHKKGKYIMKTGELDFVEPGTRGRYKKEKFDISDAEVKELQKVIIRVADEITGLKFYGKKCGDVSCKFCTLRQGSF